MNKRKRPRTESSAIGANMRGNEAYPG